MQNTLAHFQVTAYGSGNERCAISTTSIGLVKPITHEDVGVWCYTPTNTVTPSRFTATYVRNGNVLGLPPLGPGGGFPTMYAYVTEQGSLFSGGTDGSSYASGNGLITTSHPGTGQYTIHSSIDQYLTNGNVQVTDADFTRGSCTVAFWDQFDGIQVDCFGLDGKPLDSDFLVSFVGKSA